MPPPGPLALAAAMQTKECSMCSKFLSVDGATIVDLNFSSPPSPGERENTTVNSMHLILIHMKNIDSLGVAPIPDNRHIPGAAVDKQAFTYPSDRKKRTLPCSTGYYLHPNGTHCCSKCHPGTYVAQHCSDPDKATKCLGCPQGSYTAHENYAEMCLVCQRCRSSVGQREISPCTSTHDVVCGCKKHQYQTSHGSEFFCKNCSACDNGTIRQKCTEFSDTICNCHYGFFLQTEGNKCSPCSSCSEGECKAHCEAMTPVTGPPNATDLTPLLGSLVALLGAACVLLLVRRLFKPSCRSLNTTSCSYLSVLQPTKEPPPTAVVPNEKANVLLLEPNQKPILVSPATTPVPLPSQRLPDCVKSAGETQIPDRPEVFYTIMDNVPLSRWKEFVRRLGLSDNTLQIIEMEHRHVREGQYEMLRQWLLSGHDTTVERISNVLNQMEMSGCSEAIQEVLSKQL